MDTQILIRELRPSEYGLLPAFLYEAIFQPEEEKLPHSVLEKPELSHYIEGFGSQPDDYAFCAVVEGRIVGIAWVRCIEGYGHLDDETPELSMSILPRYRGQGIGTSLLVSLMDYLASAGYIRISLSVQEANEPAVHLYRKLGFRIAHKKEGELILTASLGGASQGNK